jgi:hypothetical protein
MFLRTSELYLVGLSALCPLVSATWFGCFANRALSDIRVPARIAQSADPEKTLADGVAASQVLPWLPPNPQSRSEQWIYDVFTPPEIFYNSGLKQFTVIPPRIAGKHAAAVDEGKPPPELVLMSVERPLFRLQLVGFFQSGSATFGLFENRVTAETFLGNAGKALPELGLEILKIQVQPNPSSSDDTANVPQALGWAVIRDERTGETTTLSSAERSFSPHARARLLTIGDVQTEHDVGNGDVIESGGATFEVAGIQVSPPEVVIARRGPNQTAMGRHTLTIPGNPETTPPSL